ncbi:uncharacterized protein LOC119112041 isoform X2 [Pollicipes pollicipes]|nr:uncharacterized protein LOC119112041 isoform X2 [Pollicipes pollicipes]
MMLRGRKLHVVCLLALLSVLLLAVYQVRPQLYVYSTEPLSTDGVPEMRMAPILACPPVLVESVQRPRPATASALQRVYVITPTYPRAVQVPEMTRLAQTLMLTSNVFWVVTEDAPVLTPAITEILQRSGLPHVHLLGLKPEKYSRKDFKGPVPRGVSNRMAAIEWLRKNAERGVFYFADDDNTYDYRLFEELAKTKRASAFPVGLVTQFGLSTPVVENGVLTGFYDGWTGGRTFPMDMAGFAVSVEVLLQHPKAAMPFKAGYEEDGFLKSLGLKKEDLEPLADNCTKIMVWHTQTKQPRVPFSTVNLQKYRNTNLEVLRHVVNPKPSSWRSPPAPVRRPAPPVRPSVAILTTSGPRPSRPGTATVRRTWLPARPVLRPDPAGRRTNTSRGSRRPLVTWPGFTRMRSASPGSRTAPGPALARPATPAQPKRRRRPTTSHSQPDFSAGSVSSVSAVETGVAAGVKRALSVLPTPQLAAGTRGITPQRGAGPPDAIGAVLTDLTAVQTRPEDSLSHGSPRPLQQPQAPASGPPTGLEPTTVDEMTAGDRPGATSVRAVDGSGSDDGHSAPQLPAVALALARSTSTPGAVLFEDEMF